jgi:hypothetical protein
VRNDVDDRFLKLVNFVMTLLVVCGTYGVALAEEGRTGGPTPSAEGAAVHFINLKDGTTLPAKVTIRFGLREMGVAPAGSDRANSGHHHLLIGCHLSINPFPTTSTTSTLALARPRRRLP